MTPSMEGKVVVITGGAGMIGHAAAMSPGREPAPM